MAWSNRKWRRDMASGLRAGNNVKSPRVSNEKRPGRRSSVSSDSVANALAERNWHRKTGT